MKFYEYIPNFFSGFDTEVAEINSQRDALFTVTCKRWSKADGFKKFLIEPYENGEMVRAEMMDGRKWVVGFIR